MTSSPAAIRTARFSPGGAQIVRRQLARTASEGIKFRSLKSYPIGLGLAGAVLIGSGILTVVAGALRSAEAAGRNAADLSTTDFDVVEFGASLAPTSAAEILSGIQAAQLIVGILAAMFAVTEFSSGTVQPTMLANPTRLPILLAKSVVLMVSVFAVGTLAAGVVLLGAEPLQALVVGDAAGPAVGFDAGLIARLSLATGLYLALIAAIGHGLGWIIRSQVGVIVTIIGLLVVAPLLLSAVPLDIISSSSAWLPSPAGLQLLHPEAPAGGTGSMGSAAGGLVLAGWSLAALIGAGISVKVRDV
jgi:hypothetical protein